MNFNSKFEKKLLIQFLILVTIPIMIMGFLSYKIYVEGAETRNEIVLKNYSEQIKSDYSNTFNSIRRYYINLSTLDSYKWLEKQESPPYYDFANLSKSLSDIDGGYTLSTYFTNYNFINIKYGWAMSQYGMCEYEELVNKSQVNKFISEQEEVESAISWANTIPLDTDTNYNPRSYNTLDLSGKFLVLKNRNTNNEITSILTIELNTDVLSKTATNYSSLGYETIILNNDKVLLQTNPAFTNAYLSNNFLADGRLFDEDNNIYRIIVSDLSSDGMVYVTGYDIHKNRDDASIFIYVAVSIIIGYILLYIILRRFARYIYKPFEFLQTKAENNLIQVKKQFAHNLALGTIDQERIDKVVSEFNIKESPAYKVMLFNLIADDNYTLEETYTILFEILAHCTEKCTLSPTRVKEKAVFIVGSSNYYLLEEKVAYIYSEIKSVLNKYENLNFKAGISDTIFNLISVKQGYEQCLRAINAEQKLDSKDNLSITVFNERTKIDTENAYDMIIENELVDLIERQGSPEEIRNILNIIISRIEARCSFDFEKNYCYSKLIITITNVAIAHSISLNYIFDMNQNEIFEKVNEIQNLTQIVNYFEESIVRPISENIASIKEESKEDNKEDIISNILQLISESKGSISLNECADKLNYSTTYLSKALVQYKGISFTDISNQEKLKYAKYLLLTTDLSVQEISDKLGYNNVQNFIRFFKKQTETTPLNFRKENESFK